MHRVERFTGNEISLMEIPGLEPRTRVETAPRKRFDNKAGWRRKSNHSKRNLRGQTTNEVK